MEQVQQSKETEQVQIGVFGDSISKGVVFQEEANRYGTVKKELQAELHQWTDDLQVDNFSIMGCTIRKGLSVLQRHLPKIKKYQNVLLEFGGNDCDFDWKDVSEHPNISHQPNTPPEEFEALYTEMIGEIRKQGGSPILLSLPPLDPQRYFNWISRNLNAANILHWLGGVDTIYRWQEMYSMKVALLASKLSVPFIDFRSAFLERHHYGNLLCADGIHPNLEGHKLIYRTIRRQYHPCEAAVGC
ncbi:MAG: SGNH/GDSL hydrolase family protein [Ruminococcus sp.]|nr:SGNH/GDSL hydrolase family protein [Ruminococcus sp.]